MQATSYRYFVLLFSFLKKINFNFRFSHDRGRITFNSIIDKVSIINNIKINENEPIDIY